jgi:16S rRNA (guanine527-N7)-methyltransferase
VERLVRELERARERGWIGDVGRGLVQARFLCGLWPAPGSDPLLVVDLGSGGGLPVLPALLLRSDVRARIVERNGPRAAFLHLAVAGLGLGSRAEVHQADVLDPALRELPADVVSARSFGPLAVTAEVGAHLVRKGGRLVVSGPRDEALPPDGSWGWTGWERVARAGLRASVADFEGPSPALRSVAAIRRAGG